ncbi:MAG: NAD(P)-dependent oxidoreductase [Anaerolineae bacterium]|nr:NAD(P)-dependent oxidoreductase [Anaerolineae bacterium]
MTSNQPIAPQDLAHILEHTRPLWQELRGRSLFITGGTGFIGRWLLESFLHANQTLRLGARAVVLSRDPQKFLSAAPFFADQPTLTFIQGDVRAFDFPPGAFPYIIHAATESSVNPLDGDYRGLFDTIVEGTRRTLQFAADRGGEKLLFTSSGAVYGRQPADMTHMPEDHPGAPDPTAPSSAYGEGKRAAELLCALAAANSPLQVKIARVYALVGAHMPLDIHFAMGNFVRDALKGGPVVVQSDGTPQRSFLYIADLAIWLWTMLFKGRSGRAYNAGSDQAISIADLAHTVSATRNPPAPVEIRGAPNPARPVERYVPDTRRAREELGLQVYIPLPEALARTLAFYESDHD